MDAASFQDEFFRSQDEGHSLPTCLEKQGPDGRPVTSLRRRRVMAPPHRDAPAEPPGTADFRTSVHPGPSVRDDDASSGISILAFPRFRVR